MITKFWKSEYPSYAPRVKVRKENFMRQARLKILNRDSRTFVDFYKKILYNIYVIKNKGDIYL